MAHIDNEFNKRFSNQQLPNDDFDAEGLWDAISEDMDSGQAAPDTHISITKWLLGLVVLLFIGGIFGVLYLKSDDTIITQKIEANTNNDVLNTHQNDVAVTSSNKKENTSKGVQKNIESINTINTISHKNESQKQTHIGHIKTSDVATNLFPIHNNTQTTTPLKHTSFTESTPIQSINPTYKTETPSTTLTPTNSSTTPTIEHPVADNSAKPLINNSETNNPIIPVEDPMKVSLSKLSSVVVLVEYSPSNQTSLSTLPTLKLPENEQPKPRRNLPIQGNVGFETGINTVHTYHQSDDYNDLADLKNMASKQGLGTSYGINAGLLLKDRWLLNTGIEYHQLWSKFDYEQKEQIQVAKEDQLLHLWVDAMTGDTLNQLHGDTVVNATSTRTVLHHNKFQRLSIPLEIGVQESVGKFIYGVTVGAVFNFTNNQSGRTLDKTGKIVNFDKNDATAPYKPFNIGLRINPLVGYQLSERWSLTLRPQWTWHRNTSFDDVNIKTGFHQFNVNVGLRYSFNFEALRK